MFPQHGITIGRATSNMICIEDFEVEHSHLRPTKKTRQKHLMPSPRWTYTAAIAPPSGATSSTNSLTAPWPLKCPSRAKARVSAPFVFASQMPSNDSQTDFGLVPPSNGALRPSEGPTALQSSRLNAPPSSSAASCFPGHPTHFTKHPLTTL